MINVRFTKESEVNTINQLVSEKLVRANIEPSKGIAIRKSTNYGNKLKIIRAENIFLKCNIR